MIAYFVRRIVGGVVTLFLAALVMHTFVLYAPGGPKEQLDQAESFAATQRYDHGSELRRIYRKLYDLDKPWPVGSLAWLFDPSDTSEVRYDLQGNVHTSTKGIDIFGIKGSGILTGDLGESVQVDQGMPVVDLFGPELGQFMLLLAILPSTALAFLVVQRGGRSSTNGLPNLPQSRKLFDQYLPPVRLPGL